ncbi:hypothetical protein FRC10_000222 [Ceratobasidium sp. 414]|nr:hypothetical protein FRC10_000222 [Ceratobasidium sp. 414]
MVTPGTKNEEARQDDLSGIGVASGYLFGPSTPQMFNVWLIKSRKERTCVGPLSDWRKNELGSRGACYVPASMTIYLLNCLAALMLGFYTSRDNQHAGARVRLLQMADSTNDIVIRPFDVRKDLKEVQLLVGMGSMEQLAVANRLAYLHPAAISIWLVCASAMIQALHLWPTGSGPSGWLGYLAPLPILACTALPVLFGIDWLHRPIFEGMLKSNVQSFTKAVAVRTSNSTSKNPPLHLVMEYKTVPIGCFFAQPTPSTNQKPIYRITYFHVDAPYRRAGVGNDLVSRAIKDLEKTKGEIVGVTTCLTPYTAECLQTAGFTRSDRGVQVWDDGKEKEDRAVNEKGNKADLDGQKVLFVDTRRTGWMLRLV